MVTALKGVRAVKTSQRLLQRAHDVADFRDAYLALMQVMHISQDEYMGSDRLRPRPDAQVLVGDAPEVELQRRSGTLSDVALGRCVREHDASDSEDAVLSLFLEALGPNV